MKKRLIIIVLCMIVVISGCGRSKLVDLHNQEEMAVHENSDNEDMAHDEEIVVEVVENEDNQPLPSEIVDEEIAETSLLEQEHPEVLPELLQYPMGYPCIQIENDMYYYNGTMNLGDFMSLFSKNTEYTYEYEPTKLVMDFTELNIYYKDELAYKLKLSYNPSTPIEWEQANVSRIDVSDKFACRTWIPGIFKPNGEIWQYDDFVPAIENPSESAIYIASYYGDKADYEEALYYDSSQFYGCGLEEVTEEQLTSVWNHLWFKDEPPFPPTKSRVRYGNDWYLFFISSVEPRKFDNHDYISIELQNNKYSPLEYSDSEELSYGYLAFIYDASTRELACVAETANTIERNFVANYKP